jgi:hypothetical protein
MKVSRPVFLDERAEAYPGVAPSGADPEAVDDPSSTACCNPIRSLRVSNQRFLPMARDQNLSLLDRFEREVDPLAERPASGFG